MIRPIDGSSLNPFQKYVEDHPITLLFIILVVNFACVYIIVRGKKNYCNPEDLYNKALKLQPEEAIPLLEQAASYYHPKAKLLLAKLYIDINKSDEALALVQKLNLAEAIYLQGVIHFKKEDPQQALQKFVIASIRGHVPAFICAANIFIERKNIKTAITYFERGIKANDPDCMLALSTCLLAGVGHPISRENSLRALELIRRAARLNFIDACNMLAVLFIRGLHNELDEIEVRDRLEYAANKNNKQALLSLGLQKLEGSLLYIKNSDEGIGHLKKIKDLPVCIFHIAKCYQSLGKSQKALKWFLKGAALEQPECLYQLYKITKNVDYLYRATEKDHSEALLERANIAFDKKNIDEYAHFLQRSVALGNLKATFILTKILSKKRYDDESKFSEIVKMLNALTNKFPECHFLLFEFYRLHDQEEKAVEALVNGTSVSHLDCMKALYYIHKQLREEMDSAELLLRRIQAREPSFMRPEVDTELKDSLVD